MKQTVVLTWALGLALLAGGAWADTPEVHPSYVRALGDLKAADMLLQAPDAGSVVVDQHACDTEVRHAIRELSQAARPGDSTAAQYAPSNTGGSRTQRLHEIRRLLTGALGNIQREDDGATATGLRALAVSRLTKAIRYINQAMTDSGGEP